MVRAKRIQERHASLSLVGAFLLWCLFGARAPAKRYPDVHGDCHYPEALDALMSVRTDQEDSHLEEAFYLKNDGSWVGRTTWRLLDGQKDWRYERGWAEAELSEIDIVVPHRDSAVGVAVLRHAMTRHCRAAPRPLPGAE